MDSSMMVNIGEERFDRVIGQDKFYIDKTDFIREWWETGSEVTLITRPRRFGKTLNMSTTECFFQINMRAGVICLKDFCLGGEIAGGGVQIQEAAGGVSRDLSELCEH